MPRVTRDRTSVRARPSFGVWLDDGLARARIWAPTARAVELHASVAPNEPGKENRVALSPEGQGFFSGVVPGLAAGAHYSFLLDGERAIPDPASRFQPNGVHGPSELVDPSAFEWRHRPPAHVRLSDQVIYELHVGTFTPEGTFAAAAGRLAWLADLGITAIELMPVAAFPGRHNWGYDGAALFAPSAVYGTPDDLRRLVDEAHGRGLAVLLDVVYNHFGPDGAYAAAASDRFFSDRHKSPWGRGINLDGSDAEHVRQFFIENALMWLADYEMDGLRLDATHALIDDSEVHFLAELADAVRATVDRDVLLVAEDHRNLRTLIEAREKGGWGLDGVWADDFHHIVRRMVAGDDESYFRDYRGDANELARALAHGWLYQGEASLHHEAPRGTDPTGLELWRSVITIQNHDQIGNRALGDRLHQDVDRATWRAASVLLLIAPETPLLFMGQEWAASAPFLYFTDHEPDLGRLVSEGRRDEFKLFRAFTEPASRALIPDPQALETFERSRLDWSEIDRPEHAGVLELYRELLRLRRALVPEGAAGELPPDRVGAIGGDTVFVRRRKSDGSEVLAVVRLRGAGEIASPLDSADAPRWRLVLDTEDPRFTDDTPASGTWRGDGPIHFSRPGAIVLERAAEGRRSS